MSSHCHYTAIPNCDTVKIQGRRGTGLDRRVAITCSTTTKNGSATRKSSPARGSPRPASARLVNRKGTTFRQASESEKGAAADSHTACRFAGPATRTHQRANRRTSRGILSF